MCVISKFMVSLLFYNVENSKQNKEKPLNCYVEWKRETQKQTQTRRLGWSNQGIYWNTGEGVQARGCSGGLQETRCGGWGWSERGWDRISKSKGAVQWGIQDRVAGWEGWGTGDRNQSQSGQNEQSLRSGSVEVAGLSICRGFDYGTGCSWWGSAWTPARLSLTRNHTHREGESTGGVVAGQWDTGIAVEGMTGADVIWMSRCFQTLTGTVHLVLAFSRDAF
jgi:hypothetical protein